MWYTLQGWVEMFLRSWLTAGLTDYMALAAAIVFVAWSVKFYSAK